RPFTASPPLFFFPKLSPNRRIYTKSEQGLPASHSQDTAIPTLSIFLKGCYDRNKRTENEVLLNETI
ncbi:MAG: hypothetical protein IJ508_02675, partial [Oscillospiraceae bacterium]|nr:hypothetical protein [Oscillospiraceae bacterium]